jgi:hypothetical protein
MTTNNEVNNLSPSANTTGAAFVVCCAGLALGVPEAPTAPSGPALLSTSVEVTGPPLRPPLGAVTRPDGSAREDANVSLLPLPGTGVVLAASEVLPWLTDLDVGTT